MQEYLARERKASGAMAAAQAKRRKKEKSQPRRHDATDPTHAWALCYPQKEERSARAIGVFGWA